MMKMLLSHESVTYDGLEYSLHDCVIFYRAGETETYIGKIVEIIHSANRGKQLKVVWFLRPSEIRNYLRDYEPQWNEIFLASGEGRGLSNTSILEAVLGKCTVVCISKDQRNPPPSEDEVRSADYIFSCTFDVEKLRISRKFPEVIDGFRVENFFNKRKDRYLSFSPHKRNLIRSTGNSNPPSKQIHDEVIDDLRNDQKYDDKDLVAKGGERQVRPTTLTKARCLVNENLALKPEHNSEDKRQERISCGILKEKKKWEFSVHFPSSSPSKLKPNKKVKFSEEVKILVTQNRDQVLLEPPHLHQATKAESNAGRRHWFKNLTPWKERLKNAQERGTLVLLENMDPTYSSSEVEEMVLKAFNERVEAKMIAQTPLSCQRYGKAFVIFKSKDAANTVINKLSRGCLMLTDQRPVLGVVGTIRKPMESNLFIGHYKIRPKRLTEELRNAVATSHCSQENNIEHSMAMEWCLLQEKSESWWKQLNKRQEDEMMELKKRLKIII